MIAARLALVFAPSVFAAILESESPGSSGVAVRPALGCRRKEIVVNNRLAIEVNQFFPVLLGDLVQILPGYLRLLRSYRDIGWLGRRLGGQLFARRNGLTRRNILWRDGHRRRLFRPWLAQAISQIASGHLQRRRLGLARAGDVIGHENADHDDESQPDQQPDFCFSCHSRTFTGLLQRPALAATRNLADRDLGLAAISCGEGEMGLGVSTVSSPVCSADRNACFTNRSSTEWKLDDGQSSPPVSKISGACSSRAAARFSTS